MHTTTRWRDISAPDLAASNAITERYLAEVRLEPPLISCALYSMSASIPQALQTRPLQ